MIISEKYLQKYLLSIKYFVYQKQLTYLFKMSSTNAVLDVFKYTSTQILQYLDPYLVIISHDSEFYCRTVILSCSYHCNNTLFVSFSVLFAAAVACATSSISVILCYIYIPSKTKSIKQTADG